LLPVESIQREKVFDGSLEEHGLSFWIIKLLEEVLRRGLIEVEFRELSMNVGL